MRFSIVMPTRNRATLLGSALKTALAQSCADCEIVISNNHCEDDTDDVVRRFDDPRIRLVHTERVLPMHEHWDFALRQARGDYVTFLCDDDAIHPRLLEIAGQLIDRHRPQLMAWNYAIYIHPHWPDAVRRNTLKAGLYTNQVMRVDASAALRSAFDLRLPSPFTLPLMLNSFCRRETLEGIFSAAGTLFPPTSPDYSSMVLMLSAVRDYLWLDAPLVLAGTAPEGIGASEPGYGQAFQTYIQELGGAKAWARHVPLRQQTSMNNIADSMLRARNCLDSLAGCDLNWPTYFAQCRIMLEQRDRLGVDTSADWIDYERTIAMRRPGFDSDVEAALAALRAVPLPVELPALGAVLSDLPAPCYIPPARGETAGFRESAGCAAMLEDWCAAQARRPALFVDAVESLLSERAEIQRVILYGLGRFGGFLWRELEQRLMPRGVTLRHIDDQSASSGDPRAGTLPATPSDFERCLIAVSPWECDAITRRLETRGALRGRHYVTWRDIATGRTRSGAGAERSRRAMS